jgi:hypothetical protein
MRIVVLVAYIALSTFLVWAYVRQLKLVDDAEKQKQTSATDRALVRGFAWFGIVIIALQFVFMIISGLQLTRHFNIAPFSTDDKLRSFPVDQNLN